MLAKFKEGAQEKVTSFNAGLKKIQEDGTLKSILEAFNVAETLVMPEQK